MTTKIETIAMAMDGAGVKKTWERYNADVSVTFIQFDGKKYCYVHEDEKANMFSIFAKRFGANPEECHEALRLLTETDLT